jgi:serine/threonine protein phosphatase PrpC
MPLTAPHAPSEPRILQTRSGLRVAWSTLPSEDHPTSNEDAELIDTVLDLVAVFDGVGGYEGGEVASRLARDAVLAMWREHAGAAQDLAAQRALMRDAILAADQRVREEVDRQPELTGMATTVVAARLWETPDHRWLVIHGHVGDSRLYVLRARGRLERVTVDDGVLSTHVALGLMSEEEALEIDQAERWEDLDDRQKRYFYQRGLITQAIGGRGEPEVHVGEAEVYAGDRVLLCSDGIHDNLTEREILQVLRKVGRRGNSSDALVREARKRAQRGLQATLRSKPDDISAIVIDILAVAQEVPAPRAKKPAVSKGRRTAKTVPAPRRRTTSKTVPAPSSKAATSGSVRTAKAPSTRTTTKARSDQQESK